MLSVYWEERSLSTRLAMAYRVYAMIGYGPLRKLTYFLPTVEDAGFNLGLFRHQGLELGIPLPEIRRRLLAFRPDVLAGYPSFLRDLGEALSAEEIAALGLRAISVNSEVSTPAERQALAMRFGCPVYNEYSCVETGMIAAECREHRMHQLTDNVYLEVVHEDGSPCAAGETGDVVLTSLTNFAMPFVRYRIGDQASLLAESRPCACGRSFPALGAVIGRQDESLTLPSGRRLRPWQIYEVVERPLEVRGCHLEIVREFHLQQERADQLCFRYLRGRDFAESYLDEVRRGLETLLGGEMELRIECVDSLRREGRRKRRYIQTMG
jgi:phenylacetate-CoA ligase